LLYLSQKHFASSSALVVSGFRVCLFVCVCERERERDSWWEVRRSMDKGLGHGIHFISFEWAFVIGGRDFEIVQMTIMADLIPTPANKRAQGEGREHRNN